MFPLDNITEEAAAGAEPAAVTSSSLASGARVASHSTSSQVRHLGQGGKLICSKMLCYFLLDGFVYHEIVGNNLVQRQPNI